MVRVNWYSSSKMILLWTFSGKWTSDEFYVALAECQSLLTDIDDCIPIIIDLREGLGPDNLLALAREGFSIPTSKVNQIIIVGYIPTWKSLFSVLTYTMKDFSIRVGFVETVGEAEILAEVE